MPEQSVVEERRHRVDGNGRRDGEQEQRRRERLVRLPLVVQVVQDVDGDGQVEHEVDVQHHDVPRQHRLRKIQDPDLGDEVPEPVGPPDVHGDEEQAHHHGGDGEHLPKHRDLLDRLPVVDVGGDDQEHRRGRHADQEGEVGDVEPPRHLVPHRGDDQAVLHLVDVREGPDPDEDQQAGDPGVVRAAPLGDQGQRPLEKPPDHFHRHVGRLRSRRSSRTSAACSGLPSG